MIELVSPFPPYAVPRVWSWVEPFRSRYFDDYQPATLDAFVRDWTHQDRLGRRTWGVVANDELGGCVGAVEATPVRVAVDFTFKEGFWNHGIAPQAVKMVMARIFEGPAEKLTMVAFADNRALVGMLKQAGAQIEGTLRGNTLRDGKLIDVVVLGVRKAVFNGV